MESQAHALFIVDGAYAFTAPAQRRRLNYAALAEFVMTILSEYRVFSVKKVFVNSVPDPPKVEQSAFNNHLRRLQFQVKLNEMKKRSVICRDRSCGCVHSHSAGQRARPI